MANPFELIDRRLGAIEQVLQELRRATPAHKVQAQTDSDELLTPEETAQLLKVSKVTVWQWSKPKPGILKKHTIGNQVRYLRSEVIAAATKKGGQAA
ncbi:helix-turn-helix domain-containing protein [Rudanella paleaurantiibacter]|uniref:Helix-turn-helix domain-containing protein n=1 Tax=Rudanella paleaurantiibacter TaxID=2614655 RepID=A0A7J5U012_9BACT|nr:helix-turn-helix domain-containing protein [Rudanella paleaurantiibacter]KAB7731083.1 helix-turn-helix domain-containing protein [Rudanella paleaurantiibacter]